MAHEAARARTHYAAAVAALHPGDKPALVTAEIMRKTYEKLLSRMETDGFRVLNDAIGSPSGRSSGSSRSAVSKAASLRFDHEKPKRNNLRKPVHVRRQRTGGSVGRGPYDEKIGVHALDGIAEE